MTGFTPEPTHYVLKFDELPAKGLEVVVRAGTVRERLAFDKARFADAASLEEVLAKEEQVLATFADRLVSWNLKRAGVKVEPGFEALLDLEDPLIKQIIGAWIDVITGSAGKAPAGRDPMEDSLPMTMIQDEVP